MMASMAEQRRFLQRLRNIPTQKLQQIRNDLLTICSMNDAKQSDIDFLNKIELELMTRSE